MSSESVPVAHPWVPDGDAGAVEHPVWPSREPTDGLQRAATPVRVPVLPARTARATTDASTPGVPPVSVPVVAPQPAGAPAPVVAAPATAPVDAVGALPQPRPAPDDHGSVPLEAWGRVRRARAAAGLDKPASAASRVYADGSALSRYLPTAPQHAAWVAWAADREAALVTSPLGVSELRSSARECDGEARGVAHEVARRLTVARFSDQMLRAAAKVAGVLPGFVALHVGAAVAQRDVRTVATYDLDLARVSVLYGLDVVSPGLPDRWWESA